MKIVNGMIQFGINFAYGLAVLSVVALPLKWLFTQPWSDTFTLVLASLWAIYAVGALIGFMLKDYSR